MQDWNAHATGRRKQRIKNLRTHTRTVLGTLLILLVVDGPVQARDLASNIAVHIDRQNNGSPTPIEQEYLSLIRSADGGDEIILLQKYFRNEVLNRAIVDAADRGVKVTGIYSDVVRPRCKDLLPPRSSIDCSQLFIRHGHVHHKSMVIHRTNGNTTAIIGSFNLRERHSSSPRAHTVVSFEVEADNAFFPFYKAHADNLQDIRTDTAPFLLLATERGGSMLFTVHPSERNPVEELLGNVSQCEGPLWLSYYRALPDAIGEPVISRLGELAERGCDVRFLLDRHRDNLAAEKRLQSLGVTVHYPDDHEGSVTLGHKIAMVRSGGRLHLIQSSANLDHTGHRCQYNLTMYLIGDYPAIEQALNRELSRYW